MNTEKNGQTKEVGRGRKKRLSDSERERLGSISGESQSNGLEQIGVGGKDRQGRDTTGTNVIKTTSDALGKILKRLDILEKAFNDYVGSHRQRLKARLDDNESFTISFEQEMKLIRQEIYDLAAQEDEDLENEDLVEENSEP